MAIPTSTRTATTKRQIRWVNTTSPFADGIDHAAGRMKQCDPNSNIIRNHNNNPKQNTTSQPFQGPSDPDDDMDMSVINFDRRNFCQTIDALKKPKIFRNSLIRQTFMAEWPSVRSS
jgi:hypothetical protein